MPRRAWHALQFIRKLRSAPSTTVVNPANGLPHTINPAELAGRILQARGQGYCSGGMRAGACLAFESQAAGWRLDRGRCRTGSGRKLCMRQRHSVPIALLSCPCCCLTQQARQDMVRGVAQDLPALTDREDQECLH